jgi:predicted metal-dependent phosphoesterase TrpH
MMLNTKSLKWTLIETADEIRETGRALAIQHPGDREVRAAYLDCAARLYRAAGQEGSALLCEETM